MSDMVEAVGRRYEIVCRLAGGGMADLYLARTLGPGGFERLVVIKQLAKRLKADATAVQALFDEARIAATLLHANIVQVNDIYIESGQVSIVMEFLHGHDVSHLLRRMKRKGERIPLDQAIAIVLGVCAGLHHAHERVDSEGKSLDIVHRDVSPHNVFVTYDGGVKLVDFGIARASVRKGQTEAGFIKGKPGYIAPEHIRGRKTDRRMDVWGAAVLLYELTTGITPYGSGTSFDDLAKVTKQDPPKPSSKVTDYPPELEAIVLRGMSRDPDQRYPTADALRAALEEFARGRNLDLSPFRMAALMERVFAENLEAWRQAQRLGKSLAEHVAAFRTSGAHEHVELPGDPTERSLDVGNTTNPLVTADVVVVPITAPTRLIKSTAVPTSAADSITLLAAKSFDAVPATQRALPLVPPPRFDSKVAAEHVTAEREPERPTPLAFESLVPEQIDLTPARPWQRPLAVVVAAPVVLLVSLLSWGALDSNNSSLPIETRQQTRATAVTDRPIAQPITVEPIEPEPAPAEPAGGESSIQINTAVAHADATPARKRPATKSSPKRRANRPAQSPRTPPPPPTPKPPQPAEDDLDALLPH
jgi:serine/threonine protein kinase